MGQEPCLRWWKHNGKCWRQLQVRQLFYWHCGHAEVQLWMRYHFPRITFLIAGLRRDRTRSSPILEAATQLGKDAGLGPPRLKFTQPAWLVDAPESIRGSIYFLKGRDPGQGSPQENTIVNSLADIPALMLEHDQSDILHDPDARRDYACKVGWSCEN